MTIYNIADILTGLVETILLFRLYETFCDKRDNLPPWIYCIGIFTLTILVNLSNIVFNYGILNAIGMVVAFFVASVLYRGKLSIKIMVSFLAIVLIGIMEIMILFVITLVYNITVTEAVDISSYRLLGIIVSKMLTLFIVNIIHIKFKEKSFYMGTSYWVLFLLMFTTSIVVVFLIFKLSFDIDKTYLYNLSILCSFGLLFSTFFALYLYEHLARQAEIIQNQQQYEQHLKTQLKHLDEILVTQNQIKQFKHDFINYEIGLTSYLENNDCNGARKYLDGLMDKFKSGEEIIETGNTALDAIISTKKAIAESKNIEFTTKIQIPKKLSVDPIDMCIIFGNALDNAIEACDRISDIDKKISLAIICQGESLFCKIVNTAPKPEKKIFKTSKVDKNNHGFGLENIKTALAIYNSEPTILYTENEFTLKFVIFIKE